MNSPATKRMLFTLLLMDSVGHNFHGIWRHPRARNREYKHLDLWVDLAKKAERAKIDAFFFTDVLGIQGQYDGSRDIDFEMAVNVPIGDCSMLLSALARETKDLGFLYTSSVIQHHPFAFARMISTLDHLSDGRIGWNIVTSANERAFRNFGLPGNLSHDERYAWAEEYVDVVYKLWEGSWDEGAVVDDPAKGIYADPTMVHDINHEGERYRVEGFNLLEPSPQRTPVLAQAGGSPPGLAFASSHAELMFLSAMSLEAIAQQVATVRGMARERGRRDEDILFLLGAMFVVGSTDEEAHRKWQELEKYRSQEAQVAYFSSLSGTDLGRYDPETPLEDSVGAHPGDSGSVSCRDQLLARRQTHGSGFLDQLGGVPDGGGIAGDHRREAGSVSSCRRGRRADHERVDAGWLRRLLRACRPGPSGQGAHAEGVQARNLAPEDF